MTRSPGMFSGIGSTLATGMAFGAGSEVAHQAVRSVMGGSSHSQQAPQQQVQQQTQQQQNPNVPNGGSPELSDATLRKVVSYVQTLSVPARRNHDDPTVLRGTAWVPFNQPGGNVGDLIDVTAPVTDVRIENL